MSLIVKLRTLFRAPLVYSLALVAGQVKGPPASTTAITKIPHLRKQGPPLRHYTEWVRMCKAGKKSITPIEFAHGLTEFALLGTLALRRYALPVAPPTGGGRATREAKVLAWE
jgi:hypothetical protein